MDKHKSYNRKNEKRIKKERNMAKKHGCLKGQIFIVDKCYTKKEIQDYFDAIKSSTLDHFFYKGDERDIRMLQHVLEEHIRYNFNPKDYQ